MRCLLIELYELQSRKSANVVKLGVHVNVFSSVLTFTFSYSTLAFENRQERASTEEMIGDSSSESEKSDSVVMQSILKRNNLTLYYAFTIANYRRTCIILLGKSAGNRLLVIRSIIKRASQTHILL